MSRPKHGALRNYLKAAKDRVGDERRDALADSAPAEVITCMRAAEKAFDEALDALAMAQRDKAKAHEPELELSS